MGLSLSSIDQSNSGISVGSIQHYDPQNTWFVLGNYSNTGSQTGLVEGKALNFSQNKLWVIDSKQLNLSYDYAPRIAYLNEGAGYKNKVQIQSQGATNGTATVFQNLSGYPGNATLPNADGPLYSGDWVQLSTIKGGSQLNFIVNPNNDPNKAPLNSDYRLNPSSPYNPYGPAFWATYAKPATTQDGKPFLIMGFEDILGKGSDNDFNDGMIAVDLGPQNFNAIFNSSANLGQHPKTLAQVPFEVSPTIGFLVLAVWWGGKQLLRKGKMRLALNRYKPLPE
jgi:hypothetical protein